MSELRKYSSTKLKIMIDEMRDNKIAQEILALKRRMLTTSRAGTSNFVNNHEGETNASSMDNQETRVPDIPFNQECDLDDHWSKLPRSFTGIFKKCRLVFTKHEKFRDHA